MPRLKVMTLNLWGFRGDWPARRDRLVQLLQNEEIDVLLLQEVAERPWRLNQALEIAYLTGYMMAYAPAQRYFPWPSVSTGLAILSRFPMSNPLAGKSSPDRHLPAGASERRMAQRVEVSLDGMSVVLYNTHFPSRRMTASGGSRLWGQVMQEEAVLVMVGRRFQCAAQRRIRSPSCKGRSPRRQARRAGRRLDTAGIGPRGNLPQHRRRRAHRLHLLPGRTLGDGAGSASVVGRRPVGDVRPRRGGGHLLHLAAVATSDYRSTRNPGRSLEPTGGGLGAPGGCCGSLASLRLAAHPPAAQGEGSG